MLRRLRSVTSVLALLLLGGCSSSLTPPAGPVRVSRPASLPGLLAATLMPWQLPAPISRTVVVAQHGRILIAGGLDSAGNSTSGVFRLDPQDGSLSFLGSLAQPVHDAAGALVRGRLLVFGGGSATSVATVQAFHSRTGGAVVGALPSPRSDLVSAVRGTHVYLMGGYDGATLAGSVLQTQDGRHFRTVARLPVPVRYPAAVAFDGRLFAFGGQTRRGETSAVQEVNLRTGASKIAAHLPSALAHASAFVLGNHIYITGGRRSGVATREVWSFDPVGARTRPAGELPIRVSDAGVARVGSAVYLVGGERVGPQPSVIQLRVAPKGVAVAGFPFAGRLLIADRGNNRLLLVTENKRIVWTYPSRRKPPPPGGFYFPDDAFFADAGRRIIVNQEADESIVQIAYPSGRLLWSYGHPGVAGTARGYLHEPDDAYVLKNGQVVVADAQNCRVLFLAPSGRVVHQIGSTGVCVHQPPTALGSPNGDTPLADGNVLISEINGSWVSEYTPQGVLKWAVQIPVGYPSDPQQISADRYLIADYSRPGGIYEFSRSGRILWSYHVLSGPGMLDHPSLAERLPNGLIIANDDYRHRVVVIDPVTKTIVWQYGHTDIPGTRRGYLNTPDGFDVLGAGGATPTHPATR